MIIKKIIFYFLLLMSIMSFVVGVEYLARIILKYQQIDSYYYLPNRKSWDLGKFTNICGQYDGKEVLHLYHSSNGYTQEVNVQKKENVIRLMIIGTSAVEGYRVTPEQNFGNILQKKCDEVYGPGKYEVINGGIGGYVSYQLLVYFKEVLLRLKPDIVFVYTGSNDISYRSGIDERTYYEQMKMLMSSVKEDIRKRAYLFKYGIHGLNWFYRFLAESRFLGYIYFTYCEWDSNTLLSRFRNRFFPLMLRMPPSDQEYVMKEFIQLSRENNFRLIFAPEVLRQASWGDDLKAYRMMMRNLARKYNIEFVDLLPIIRNYPEDTFYLANDQVHFTAFGHAVIGETLFETIIHNANK